MCDRLQMIRCYFHQKRISQTGVQKMEIQMKTGNAGRPKTVRVNKFTAWIIKMLLKWNR